jgi:hypothetical protein
MIFADRELAQIKSCAILQDLAPERVAQALAERPENLLDLPPGTVFISAGQTRQGFT